MSTEKKKRVGDSGLEKRGRESAREDGNKGRIRGLTGKLEGGGTGRAVQGVDDEGGR